MFKWLLRWLKQDTTSQEERGYNFAKNKLASACNADLEDTIEYLEVVSYGNNDPFDVGIRRALREFVKNY